MARRNGSTAEAQLTLDVGKFDAEVLASTFKAKAISTATAQLLAGETATVVMMDASGTVLAEAEMKVVGVHFKRHPATTKQPAWVERTHTLEPIDE